MKIENLNKANQLKSDIEFIEHNIKKLKYIQSTNVVERESYLTFNGISENITIPEEFFKKIGKTILNDYNKKLKAKQLEFNNL